MSLAYLIPEFPGQTHIWMWREIVHLREWGVDVRLYSTRPPKEHERARHRFADDAAKATRYLAPVRPGDLLASVAWLAARPLRLLKAIRLARSLPLERGKATYRNPLKLIVPAAMLARSLKRDGATHLHVHSCASAAVLAMLVKTLAGIPFSLTLNADIGWWGGAMREKFEAASFTIAITRKLLDELIRDYPTLRPEQRLLGRIGVDTRVNLPATPPTRDGVGRTVVTVARLHPSKGHDVLIRAIGRLRDRGTDVALRLAGAGPQRAELESLVGELNLADRVSFLGSIGDADVIRELQAADAFVLASHAEPLGVAYMEAMACGVPTIGTAAGGVGEIIDHDVDGLLVPPRDPDALADVIDRLVKDPSLRARLSHAGREKIVRAFDSSVGARTLYERVFGQPPRPLIR